MISNVTSILNTIYQSIKPFNVKKFKIDININFYHYHFIIDLALACKNSLVFEKCLFPNQYPLLALRGEG